MRQPVEPVYRLFGAKVEQIRNVLGWTQADLAKKIGQSRAALANIEGGKQRVLLHHVEAFAKAFGMTAKEFSKGLWP